MKFIALIVTFASISALAEIEIPKLPEPSKPYDQMTKEERKAYSDQRKAALAKFTTEQRQAFRERNRIQRIAEDGGLVRKSAGSIGRVVIANTQEAVAEKELKESVSKLTEAIKVNISVEKMGSELSDTPEAALVKAKAQALIMVVDNPTDPSLLVAPEARWAKVNVGKLKEKNAEARTRQEVLRAFAFLCGGISSHYPHPMTGYIGDPSQFDDMPVHELPVDVIGRFSKYLGQMGITPYVEKTYLKACQEGWAPAPTNDIQKAIWSEVHAIPSKPIKIEYNEKRDKGK